MESIDKYPQKLKCCICGEVMDRVVISMHDYDYKCRNDACVTCEVI